MQNLDLKYEYVFLLLPLFWSMSSISVSGMEAESWIISEKLVGFGITIFCLKNLALIVNNEQRKQLQTSSITLEGIMGNLCRWSKEEKLGTMIHEYLKANDSISTFNLTQENTRKMLFSRHELCCLIKKLNYFLGND